MYKKVLIPIKHPTDVNRLSELASTLIGRGQITFLTVMQEGDFFETQKEWRASVDAIERHRGNIIDRRIDVVPKIRYSDNIAQGIMDQAEEDDADLIVLGWSDKATPLHLGQTPVEKIFAQSSRDVVTFKNRVGELANIERILFAIGYKDFDYSNRLSFIAKMVEASGADLVLTHVIPEAYQNGNEQAFFEEPKVFVEDLGIEPETKTIIDDSPGKGMVSEARENDLIVLGATKRHGLSKHIMMSMSENIVNEVPCSALIFSVE